MTDLHIIKPRMELRPLADATEYELLIYGDIGESWWGESVAAKDVVQQLAALDPGVQKVNVRLNSYGGSVSDALAIYNVLKRTNAQKVGTVDGVAMSSASLIAMACDELQMPQTSMLMIHAPWGVAQGNANDMREMANVLDTYAQAMSNAYASKSGLPLADVMGLLTDGADHYYTGQQAIESGFADTLIDDPQQEDDDEEEDIDVASFAGMQRFLSRAPQHIAVAAFAAAYRHIPHSAARAAKHPAAVAAPTQEVTPMPTPATAAAAPGAQSPVNENEVRAAALAAIRDRNTAISAALKPVMQIAGIAELHTAALADPDMSIEQVNARALALAGAQAQPVNGNGGHVEAGRTDAEKFRAGVEQAVMARANLAKPDAANEFRGFSLFEIARAAVERTGKSTGRMSRMEVVAAGFTSTSDFPNLLANIANKSLLKGWAEAGETYPQFTSEGTLNDFKPTMRVDLNEFSSLSQVPEGAEYQQGSVGDRGETIQLAKYGRLFSVTREAIINDDLNALSRIPMKMGVAAKRTVGNLVFAILTGNPNMADGVALFASGHKNMIASGSGGPILTASVDAARVAMAKQTDPNGNAIALNIKLANLIVPVALGGAARTVRDSTYQVDAITTAKGSQNTIPNSVRGLFSVIEDARLDAVSSTGWFATADASQFDVIEVAYLDGQNSPYLEQRDGWTVDGTEMKVRIEAGVKALDFRTLFWNYGS